jgi:DNA helicase-2/ATP-dependent DNA helicase PcrA
MRQEHPSQQGYGPLTSKDTNPDLKTRTRIHHQPRSRLETRTTSYHCSQEICDFADGLYPDLPRKSSDNAERPDHLGVFVISRAEALDYAEKYSPVVLRENKNSDTVGLAGVNIGVSKGSTLDRVLVFQATTTITYMKTKNLSPFKSAPRLYVAATRARFSATFVDMKS